MSGSQRQDSDSEDGENDNDKDVRHVMRESRDIFKIQEMHRSHRGVDSSQAK